MSNASRHSAALDNRQGRVQTTGIPGTPTEQVPNNENRRSSQVYAEAIPGVMKAEVEAWGAVGNSATQALAGVCASVRVVLGYGALGLARLAVAVVQNPSEGWRLRERERENAAARQSQSTGEMPPGRWRNLGEAYAEQCRMSEAQAGIVMMNRARGLAPGGTVVRRRGGGAVYGQTRGGSGSAATASRGGGGRGRGPIRGARGARGGEPVDGTVPIRRGQRSGRV